MRKLIKLLSIPIFLAIAYFAGPKASYSIVNPQVTPFKGELSDIPEKILQREMLETNLKPDNEARILWVDSIRTTEYAVVFLHGFSASPQAGEPIASDFAKRYGCNLYLPRLAQHGTDDPDTFKDLTPGDLLESAKEAIAIGKRLGKKVIVMASSTGATLATYLAAENPNLLDGLVFYSPNFEVANDLAFLLTKPWGGQLNRLVHGGDYRVWEPLNEEVRKYWTTTYHIQGVVCLQNLIDQTMKPEIFQKIEMPVFVGYYYKNEEEKDEVISIDAIHEFMESISTPEEKKRAKAFANVDSHVIQSSVQSKDVESVRKATYAFAEEVLNWKPVIQ